jgi:tRNA nucleotidyltransferase/poly(A) polymerase
MFSSADIPVTPIVNVDEEKKPVMSGIYPAQLLSMLSPYNPNISPTILKEIADDIVTIQHQTDDVAVIIATLENLSEQCQFPPQLLAFLAHGYSIIDNKERAIGAYQDCIQLHEQTHTQQNNNNQNYITYWRYQLSALLTSTMQYEEARLVLARALFPDTAGELNTSLNIEILTMANTLNEKLLRELQQQAHHKLDTNLEKIIYHATHIQQSPMMSGAYVHRATAFVIRNKATKDQRTLESAFADYCMAHWLVSTGFDANIVKNGKDYQQILKKNCSTLAGKLGYIKTTTASVKNTELFSATLSPENEKIDRVTMKAQSLHALNPGLSDEDLHSLARRLYNLYLMPAVVCVPILNKIKIHCNLDPVTLAFIAGKEKELLQANLLIHKHAEKNISSATPSAEKTAETKKLLNEFKDADINEKAIPPLISLLELDLDTGLTLLDINEQDEIFKKAIKLLKKLHHLSDPKDIPIKNAKTMATQFAKKNSKKAIEYINQAITEEYANPKNYLFRAEMQLQEAKNTHHYQLALADYYFAQWIAARACGTTLLDAVEIKKIPQKINSTKEKMTALEVPTVVTANAAPAKPPKQGKNRKKKKHSVRRPEKKTSSNNTAPPSSEQKNTSNEPRLPPRVQTAPLSSSPIMLSAIDKASDEKDQKSIASNTTPLASSKISLPTITAADYGDWDNDQGFTLHTNRKQKREKPLPQNSCRPKPQAAAPLKKKSDHSAPALNASLGSKPARWVKRNVLPITIKTPAAIATPAVMPLAVTPETALDLTKTPAIKAVKSKLRKVNLPPEASAIILKLKTAGAKSSWIVGGIVRDDLSNANTEKADIDIVTEASAADLKKWFPQTEYPDQDLKKNNKLFQFTINKRKIEIWTSDYLANPAAANPLKDDALSRGFNIEALYADENGNTFDPLKVYGYTEIDTLADSVTSLQYDPIRILRAIYLSHKTALKLSARLDKAIDETIACLKTADKFSLCTLITKIIHSEKSVEILNELDRRDIIRKLFPEFIDRMSSQEIAERIRSVSVDNTLSWVYINMAIDTAINSNKYHRVMAIQNPQSKLMAINQLLSEIQHQIMSLNTNKLLSATFSNPNHFDHLLEKAFRSNPIMTNLRAEQNILVKAAAQAKNAIEIYAEENHALRQQNEALIKALQQQKFQQAAAEEDQQQLAEQQDYQQYLLYQQSLYAPPMQPMPVFYNNQPPALSQHRNGFVNSWQREKPHLEHPYQQHTSVTTTNEYKRK